MIQDSEDKLQKSMFILNRIADEYGFKISANKTKTKAFRGKQPVKSKIVIDGKIMERAQHFSIIYRCV